MPQSLEVRDVLPKLEASLAPHQTMCRAAVTALCHVMTAQQSARLCRQCAPPALCGRGALCEYLPSASECVRLSQPCFFNQQAALYHTRL